ncbi:MAG: SGNH/GDSL hydrolase family protein, partial [Puniceicoccales bacterium]
MRPPRIVLPFFVAIFATAILCCESWVPKIVFTGEPVLLRFKDLEGIQEGEFFVITPAGERGPEVLSLAFEDGNAEWIPPAEGIYRVCFGEREVRGLAMNPPSFFDEKALLTTLPRQGPKLLSGEPYTIFAMGDSVTATGDYPTMLAMLLRRATGNDQVAAVVRAYPGCSNDASVRNWWRDCQGVQPDLGLIMYGLNDEGAKVPLPAYVEQTEWLVEHLRKDFAADVMLLEPTPDTGMVLLSRAGEIIEPAKIFRTRAFAAAIRDWADEREVPVADTFDALWCEGGGNLIEVGRQLWPMFPLHYSKPFTSLIENEGRGDTIHPNALGHLAL